MDRTTFSVHLSSMLKHHAYDSAAILIADYIDSKATSPAVVTVALNPPEASDTPDAFTEAMKTIELQAKYIDALKATIVQAISAIRDQYSYEAVIMLEHALNTSFADIQIECES